MKLNYYLRLGLLGAVLLIACKDEEKVNPEAPIACFEIGEGSFYAETPIAFDASCTVNGSIYAWDFGDGNLSTTIAPTHIYEVEGTYNVTLVVTNELELTHTISKSITVEPSPFIKHSGLINSDEIWEEGLHLVQSTITINDGSLKIMPGAEVYMSDGSNIIVGGDETTVGGSTLIAQGTADKPIVFRPVTNEETPGLWGHIYFTEQASSNSILDYCEIKYGGKSNSWILLQDYWELGMIHLDDASIAITNSTIIGPLGQAILLTSNANFQNFNNNRVEGNTEYVMGIGVKALHTLGANNDFVSDFGIEVLGQHGLLDGSVRWYNQGTPYIVNLTINMYDTLYIEGGTVFKLAEQALFNSYSYVMFDGASDNQILFTSLKDVPSAGDWPGVRVGSCDMNYTTIEYAGGDTFAAKSIAFKSGTGKVTNSSILNSGGMGILMEDLDKLVENNLIQNCTSYGFAVNDHSVHKFDLSNVLESTAGLLVTSSAEGITEKVTWPKIPYNYIVDFSIYITSGAGSLTIAPDVTVEFNDGGGFEVGTNYNENELIAIGTPEKPINFILSSATNANWNSIKFGQWTSANSALKYCNISGGGNNSSNYGMLLLWQVNGVPVIENCNFSDSDSYGITSYFSSTTPVNCTFTNMQLGDVDTIN